MLLNRTRKKINYKTPRYSQRFSRAFRPGSLRSKLFKFMRDYPLSTLDQACNYFQEEYRPFIANINDFKNKLHVYRCQYFEQFGHPATPPKDQLQAIRKGYDIPFYSKNEFQPIPEVVADKIIEKEQSELERLNAITLALRSHRY